jgi:hypothetical protein
MRGTLLSFLDTGHKIDGTINTLLVLDEKGAVVESRPGTGNRDVDRRLDRTWKLARFEPYQIGGCRVRACVRALPPLLHLRLLPTGAATGRKGPEPR